MPGGRALWFGPPVVGLGNPQTVREGLTVFFRSMLAVRGPTPRGTGLIKPAISTAASKLTPPLDGHLLPCFFVDLVPSRSTPTSTMQAPGLIHSGLISPRTPAVTMKMSAIRLWAIFDVVYDIPCLSYSGF